MLISAFMIIFYINQTCQIIPMLVSLWNEWRILKTILKY